MKHVQACLTARKGPLWRSCEAGASQFMCGKPHITPFSQARRCCEARAGLFKWQERLRKQFSLLGRSFEAGASLFMCEKRHTTPFSPPKRGCEARAGHCKCQ